PVGRQECLVINLRPFVPDGGSYLLEYRGDQCATSLIDRVYFLLNEVASVPAYEYGSTWALGDEERGARYCIGGGECRTRGRVGDERSIESLGIRPGDRLAVVHGTAETGA